MSNFTVSPGVTTNEIDQSFLSPLPVKVGAAIIGPTVKGPIEIPTIVTSYSAYKNIFGASLISGSDSYSYLTSIAAYSYFTNGGESLLVSRIVTGTYTSATSSITGTIAGPTSSAFILETLSEGTIMNNDEAANSDGSLPLGSKDNIRYEITNANTSSGAFNVVIRRGNDKPTDKVILETFNNVNLDPNSTRYISKVIGDQVVSYNSTENQIDITTGSYPNVSNFIRVKSITTNTPNYLDNTGTPVAAYTSSVPLNGTGSFGAATGTFIAGVNFYDSITTQTQGVTGSDYDNMVNLLSNKSDYVFNILLTPGLVNESHSSTTSTIISNTQQRGDNIYITDMVGYDGTQASAITQANTINSSYATTYWPWLRIQDPDTGKQVWVPASTMMGGVFAFNDKVGKPWLAPAGIMRGGLTTVLRAKSKLSESNKAELYTNNVNPIATLPRKRMIAAFGQKTLQKGASALDRVNVRRLMIELKSYISQVSDTLVFEQNTARTRSKFINQVTPYLEGVQQKEGLYAFEVRMDEKNNTPDIIDRNQLVGQIYIQPTKSVEFISIDFIIQPTGAEFPE